MTDSRTHLDKTFLKQYIIWYGISPKLFPTPSSNPHPAALNDDKCEFCPIGTYKTTIGNSVCLTCPSMETSLQTGSSSIKQCVCKEWDRVLAVCLPYSRNAASSEFFLPYPGIWPLYFRGTYRTADNKCEECPNGAICISAHTPSYARV